jgi:predicted amino acid dehydrogenase
MSACEFYSNFDNWSNQDGEEVVIKVRDIIGLMEAFASEKMDRLVKSRLGDVSVCAEKPPLGLKPRKFVDEDRLREVQGAMDRYYYANKPMPLEWITEYNELVERLH